MQMIKFMIKQLKNYSSKRKSGNQKQAEKTGTTVKHQLSSNLQVNIKQLHNIFEKCQDVVFRDFKIAGRNSVTALLIYVNGLADTALLSESTLKPLMIDSLEKGLAVKIDRDNAYDITRESLLAIGEVSETNKFDGLVENILAGSTALLLDCSEWALIIDAKGWKSRSVEEPQTETVIRGSRDGFTESINVNTALLRRRIRTPDLKMERFKVGELTKTDVAITYIKGVVNDDLVEEVENRISGINVDSILESGYIEELIEDSPFSPFNQLNLTERPDKTAAGLLEGQVAIFVDNTPFVLLAPCTFPQLLQSPEDYYTRYPWATFIRFLRFVALNTALLLPGLYVAITTQHPEMIPTPLAISIAAAREGLPFPTFAEVLGMEMMFEILWEAGARMPRVVGQAVSIVGALVLGQAAVTAKLVSPATVVIVAITALSSMTIPTLTGSHAIRLIRFPLIILGGILGFFGIMMALLAMLVHLCSLRSFGMPFLAPLAPNILRDLKDSIIRFPWWAMQTRPTLIGQKNPVRQGKNQKPNTPAPRKRQK